MVIKARTYETSLLVSRPTKGWSDLRSLLAFYSNVVNHCATFGISAPPLHTLWPGLFYSIWFDDFFPEGKPDAATNFPQILRNALLTKHVSLLVSCMRQMAKRSCSVSPFCGNIQCWWIIQLCLDSLIKRIWTVCITVIAISYNSPVQICIAILVPLFVLWPRRLHLSTLLVQSTIAHHHR